jgi:hypothetical protein
MAEQELEPKKGFKIVDRRRFTDDGTERVGPDVAPDNARRADPPAAAGAQTPASASPTPVAPTQPAPGQAAAPTTAGPTPATAPPAPKKPVEDVTAGGLTFSIFLQSLAQQALMQLGLIAWPHGQRELHLDQARDTIEIVALLKTKTTGNLTPEEQQLIDAVAYELRMSYVEVQTAIARSKGAQAPRPPGG